VAAAAAEAAEAAEAALALAAEAALALALAAEAVAAEAAEVAELAWEQLAWDLAWDLAAELAAQLAGEAAARPGELAAGARSDRLPDALTNAGPYGRVDKSDPANACLVCSAASAWPSPCQPSNNSGIACPGWVKSAVSFWGPGQALAAPWDMGHSIEFISFLARCSHWPGRQVVSRFRAKTTSA